MRMNPIHYTRDQVALMIRFASTEDFAWLAGKREEVTAGSFGLKQEGAEYVFAGQGASSGN